MVSDYIDASLEVERLPVLRDNYVFVLYGPAGEAVVVDPAIAPPVLERLGQRGSTLRAILNTHHHSDHVGGNRELLKAFPKAVVYGSGVDQGRIPGQTVVLSGGEELGLWGQSLGASPLRVLFVPGHTRGHVAYYLAPGRPGEVGHLFCGDTLFAGGCGRLFEGTPGQMLASLQQLRSLPEETLVWCAHEYTLGNLRFAVTVEPGNVELQERLRVVEAMRSRGEATIPTQIGLEKRTNPFLRWDVPAIQEAMGHTEPVRVFARLRGKKDLFA